jgi:hypothetical protein
LLSGRRLERGALVRLSPPEWLSRWTRCRGNAPEFGSADPDTARWHRQRAAACAASRDSGAELFHLDHLAARNLADWTEHARRAELYEERPEAALAVAAMAEAARLNPDDPRLRARLGDLLIGAGDPTRAAEAFAKAAELRGATWARGGWWIAGPYAGDDRASSLPPEAQADVSRPIVEPGATDRRWRRLDDAGPTLALHRWFNPAEHVTGYAQLFVYSREARRVTLSLGADDSLRLWHNGRPIFERDRFFKPGDGRVEVTLTPGLNRLLAKVVNDTVHHELYVDIRDAAAEAGAGRRRQGTAP